MDSSNLSSKEHITKTISPAVIAQKKTIAVLILALLAVLLLLIIVLVSTMQKSISPQMTTSTKPNVNLKKEYENPFSTRTQYVNPFSDYKNPFDNLNEN